MKQRKGQQGFTLVEIAIVLVIIGLLLGGVLKGRSMIENARVSNAVNSINGIVAGFFTYMDRYGVQPGDDGTTLAILGARGGAWGAAANPTITVAGNRNGEIANDAANTFTGASVAAALEGLGFWQHLRAAGIISGNPNATGTLALPTNAFGGLTGFTNAAVMGLPEGNKLCLGHVPGAAAAALDNRLDDGVSNRGRLRATLGPGNIAPAVGAAAVAAPAYNEAEVFTICVSF